MIIGIGGWYVGCDASWDTDNYNKFIIQTYKQMIVYNK